MNDLSWWVRWGLCCALGGVPVAAASLPARVAPPASVAALLPTVPPQDEVAERLRQAAQAAGVTDYRQSPRADGGFNVIGQLAGNAFALRVPPRWTGQSVLYAHGYVVPDLPEPRPDPAGPGDLGLLGVAYAQGFLAADSAYAKTGYAVDEGVQALSALRALLVAAGSARPYVAGASMGGTVVVALIEQFPDAFAGALSVCGATPGWRAEWGFVLDVRLVYDYFTRGTPYALPGQGHAAVVDPALTPERVTDTVSRLFAAARRGDVAAGRIVAQVARVAGVQPDPVSVWTPLLLVQAGLGDALKTMNGVGIRTVDRVYRGSDDDRALNAGIERLDPGPVSGTYLDRHSTATGQFHTPLLTLHNLADPLVPTALAAQFSGVVARAGNTPQLAQQFVDRVTGPDGGPQHCAFTRPQLLAAWTDLRRWAEQGVRPPEGLQRAPEPLAPQ